MAIVIDSASQITLTGGAANAPLLMTHFVNPANWPAGTTQATVDTYITRVPGSYTFVLKAGKKILVKGHLDQSDCTVWHESVDAFFVADTGGFITGGRYIAGKVFARTTWIFLVGASSNPHPTSALEGFLRGSGRIDMVGLRILNNDQQPGATGGHTGIIFWAGSTGGYSLPDLEVLCEGNVPTYVTFNTDDGNAGTASVSIRELRAGVIRHGSANVDLSFRPDGGGWIGGDNGGTVSMFNKLLKPATRTVYKGLAPVFQNPGDIINITDKDFNSPNVVFLDAQIGKDRITMYPNSSANQAEIQRTATFSISDVFGAPVSGATVSVTSDRVVATAGTLAAPVTTQLFNAAVDFGDTEVLRVWRGTGARAGTGDGTYLHPNVVTDDTAMTVRIRHPLYQESVTQLLGELGDAKVVSALPVNSSVTGTVAAAAAITGVSFVYDSTTGTVSVAVTANLSAQEIYNAWASWVTRPAQMGVAPVPVDRLQIQAGSLVVTGSLTTAAVVSAGGNVVSIKATGAITSTGSGSYTLPIEDSAGVRVTVRKAGGGNFNIAARRGTTGAYTDLGYQAGVSTVTYSVPKGQPVEVAAWAEGFVTYTRLIDTAAGGVVLAMEMTANPNIDTALDVSSYLSNIALSLDTSGATPFFVITFNAPMTVSGIELGKAIIHRLVGSEVALRAGFPPGSTSTIVINSDEITNQLPAVRLAVGAGVPVTGRVYLDFFINQLLALALNPAYVINPPRADGNQVQILRAKPALDASVMAAAVAQAMAEPLSAVEARVIAAQG